MNGKRRSVLAKSGSELSRLEKNTIYIRISLYPSSNKVVCKDVKEPSYEAKQACS